MKRAPIVLSLMFFACGSGLPIAVESSSQDYKVKLMRDDAKGLTWATCVIGQSGDGCRGDAALLAWADALNAVRGSELGGITNWRMPRIEELEAMHRRIHARLDTIFPGLRQSIVWSASANIDYATDAWAFDFSQGKRIVRARDQKLQVLLVSGP